MSSDGAWVRPFLKEHRVTVLLLSVAVLIPCFWHHHIESGDLPSHVYNAWLTELAQQGKAPGVYVATQWSNIFFDLMLLYLGKLFGFAIAEKLAVSFCVLVFFWGVFALIAAVSGRPPWAVAPITAMLSYGYVFYMGFMNFYLSIGVACWALAAMWSGKKLGRIAAVCLIPFILLAHPLGFLFFLGVGGYRLLWSKLSGRMRLLLPVAAVAIAVGVHIFVLKHPSLQPDWLDEPFYHSNGMDQFEIFGSPFVTLKNVLAAFLAVCILADLFVERRKNGYFKDRWLIVELYLVSLVTVALLPENLLPDPTAGWIGMVVTRLTVILAIFGLCWLATLCPRNWHAAGFAAVALVYFGFLYQETGFLNRLEQNAEQITGQLPFGTRLLVTVYQRPGDRDMTVHSVERACIGHCFVFSDYEPSTKAFRLRVKPGSPVVTDVVSNSEDMASGTYDVQEEDLPLKDIYQCDRKDLTKLCIRDLVAGEENGRAGYRPVP
jgi:EpsG family